jgi:hypothetical protein
MKAISMWQPHGSLLTTGAKPFETRGWSTKFRGPILIHAAARFNRREWLFYMAFPQYRAGLAPLIDMRMDFAYAPLKHWIPRMMEAIPRGAFIGMAELIDCIPTEKMTAMQMRRSRGFGDFSPGRFAWEVADVKRFKNPIPAKGHQGFFYASVNLAGNELIPVPASVHLTEGAGKTEYAKTLFS